MTQIRCAIVDDDEQIIRLLAHVLKLNWDSDALGVQGYVDPREALAAINSIDLLVTDIDMPRLDGLYLIAASQERNPSVHSMVISGSASMQLLERAAAMGASDYILKPLDHAEVVKRVSMAVDRIERWRSVMVSTVTRHWL